METDTTPEKETGTDSPDVAGCPAPICSQKRATPETERALYLAGSLTNDRLAALEPLCRKLERERDAALAREAAIREFCEVEMSWEWFRAEFNIGDTQNKSLQNAKKLKEFLSANASVEARQK